MLKIIEAARSFTRLAPSSNKNSVLPLNPQAVREEAVIVNLSNSGFLSKLEKHIDDYYKGRSYLSAEVAKELDKKEESASTSLAHHGGKLSLAFGAYAAALNYGQKARFIDGVSRAADTVQKISGAQNNPAIDTALSEN